MDKRKVYLYAFLSFILIWGIGYLSYYPGTIIQYDALASLRHGPVNASRVSPILFNYAVYGCIKLGIDIGNPNFGVALFCILQMIISAAIYAYMISWLYSEGVNQLLILVVWGLYALHPIFALMSFSMVKDVWYSLAIFLWLPFIYKEITDTFNQSARNRMVIFGLLIAFTMISRNNGTIVSLCVIILLALFSKKMRVRYLLTGGITFAAIIIVSKALTGNIEHNFSESAGPYLQQIAMVYSYDDDIDEADREMFEKILPQEGGWTNIDDNPEVAAYAPMCADNLKFLGDYNPDNEYLNAHKFEFVTAYLRTLIKNPDDCFQAYLLETFGFWENRIVNYCQSCITAIEENEFDIYQEPLLPDSIDGIVKDYYSAVWSAIGVAGAYIWILFFVSVVFIVYNKKRNILIFAPMLFNWIVIMLATPIAFAFRYVYYYLMVFPILIVLLIDSKISVNTTE